MGVDSGDNFYENCLENWLADVSPTLSSHLSTPLSIDY